MLRWWWLPKKEVQFVILTSVIAWALTRDASRSKLDYKALLSSGCQDKLNLPFSGLADTRLSRSHSTAIYIDPRNALILALSPLLSPLDFGLRQSKLLFPWSTAFPKGKTNATKFWVARMLLTIFGACFK